jgi:glycosyltransferase involved in cell wall biosynthesis
MRVLMVCTEYPPMPGGVGRYTANLTRAIRGIGIDVDVVCDEMGGGQYSGISPTNTQNSEVLLELVNKVAPDVVHVQFEPGLYGLVLDPTNPRKSSTHIDSFYAKCKVPIVTTFHSAYTFRQWMNQAVLMKRKGRTGRLGIPARAAVRTWKYFLNYKSFNDLNKEKLRMSRVGISFSHYLASRIGGGQVIYHGAEPAVDSTKQEARKLFSLPEDRRIALVLGFRTATKGWDILDRMKMPEGWVMVLNSSKGHYNTENLSLNLADGTIDLKRGFLDEKQHSMLLLASDAIILPYKITSGSGVMFDALAHGLPFVASDLEFFREFSAQRLGVTVRRTPEDFSKGLEHLSREYDGYAQAVDRFREKLRWENVARQHAMQYMAAAGASVQAS